MPCLKTLRARKSRTELLFALGGKCARCPRADCLEFDCVLPQGPQHHHMPAPERMRFYWRQHCRGNLQVLCATCHLRKTQDDNRKINGVKNRIWAVVRDSVLPLHCP